jgi:hypothetical protein
MLARAVRASAARVAGRRFIGGFAGATDAAPTVSEKMCVAWSS